MKKPDDYPATVELDRLKAAKEEFGLDHVGRFLEWLEESGFVICEWHHDKCTPSSKGIAPLLAAYAEIDMSKVEDEKRALLEYVRSRSK